jgi:hypothetical protein
MVLVLTFEVIPVVLVLEAFHAYESDLSLAFELWLKPGFAFSAEFGEWSSVRRRSNDA